ncbi:MULTISPECIES: MoxR family ATPase [unclassified Nitratiruptor]|uniref:AAA family ATPase n=1 Tax=unclassified Nitratiruptor TaxID=2624044 RepID=UPI0019151C24|nr:MULTISPECIES: MoxR family ATPase [unclassified Nitratiruptor]BCD59888.1 MoxR-like ATPase [Nitratiruptor sp. YY08-10]BCD63811.1 MoxR-like ATPase [Nitratiruptor sp. YY08-14]
MIFQSIKAEIQKVIVGQEEMIDAIILALLCEGHVLLEGLPGLAKTTTIKTLAQTLGIDSKRVQFTPDLLPSDITGAQIFNPKTGDFTIKHGPIFTNLLLADEINRAPAKVQSALLEAMQERQVTIAEESFALPFPFVVMATQNPIEQEGTYRLPEAQLDRFMFKIELGYNTPNEELEILERFEKKKEVQIQNVLSKEELKQAKEQVESIHIEKALKNYIVQIVQATRDHPDTMYGSSPRGSIDLLKASKAVAYKYGRDYVTPKDILDIVKPTLRHRVILNYEARAEGKNADMILESIMKEVPIP